MADLDLARQLVAYLDATTEPVTSVHSEDGGLVLAPEPDEPRAPRWLVAAAAVAVVAALGVLLALTTGGDRAVDEIDRPEPSPSLPAPSLPTPTSVDQADGAAERHRVAIDRAAQYFEALSTNDAETVLALSDPTIVDDTAETDLVRWWWATAWPTGERTVWPSGACGAADADDGGVRVTCPVTVTDPVADAVGLDDLTWSATVGDDGLVRREPAPVDTDDGTYQAVWREYAEYLATYRGAEYADVCDPASAAGSPAPGGWLVLNGRCAQSVVRVSDMVALLALHGEQAPAVLAAETLVGHWVNTEGFDGLFVDFRTDGTFSIGNTGELGDGAFASGTYEVEVATIRFTVSPTSSGCRGETWSWRGRAPVDGMLEVDTIPNGGCVEDAHWQWVRVSPASPAAVTLDTGLPDVGAVDRTPAPIVPGIWLRLGTSEVLAIAPDRSYLLTRSGDTLAPVDRGEVVEVEPGIWAFTSAGGGECAAGSTWTWADVSMPGGVLDRGSTLDVSIAATATPTCGGADTPAEWLLLSPDPNN